MTFDLWTLDEWEVEPTGEISYIGRGREREGEVGRGREREGEGGRGREREGEGGRGREGGRERERGREREGGREREVNTTQSQSTSLEIVSLTCPSTCDSNTALSQLLLRSSPFPESTELHVCMTNNVSVYTNMFVSICRYMCTCMTSCT